MWLASADEVKAYAHLLALLASHSLTQPLTHFQWAVWLASANEVKADLFGATYMVSPGPEFRETAEHTPSCQAQSLPLSRAGTAACGILLSWLRL